MTASRRRFERVRAAMPVPLTAGLALVCLSALCWTPSSAQTPSWTTNPGQAQRTQAPAPQRKPRAAPTPGAASNPRQPAGQTATPAAPPDWIIQCQNAAGGKGFNCQMSRAVVLKTNRKLVLKVTVNLPARTKKPSLVVQTPFGLYLPAGIKLQIDDEKPQPMIVQTCNQNGCFTGGPLSDQLLTGMKKGKQLKAIFQNLQKKNISVALPLSGFSKHYAQMEGR